MDEITRKNNAPDDPIESSRREFIKTAGKIAVYTPPAMFAVARPSFAHAQSAGLQTYQSPDQVREQYGDEQFDSLWRRFLNWLHNNS